MVKDTFIYRKNLKCNVGGILMPLLLNVGYTASVSVFCEIIWNTQKKMEMQSVIRMKD